MDVNDLHIMVQWLMFVNIHLAHWPRYDLHLSNPDSTLMYRNHNTCSEMLYFIVSIRLCTDPRVGHLPTNRIYSVTTNKFRTISSKTDEIVVAWQENRTAIKY